MADDMTGRQRQDHQYPRPANAGPGTGAPVNAAPGGASVSAQAGPTHAHASGHRSAEADPAFTGTAQPNSSLAFTRQHIDFGHARAARRHSIFVAVMKGLLPSLAVCFVVALILWSQGVFDAKTSDAAFEPSKIDLSGSGVKMVSPKLTGLDRDDQRFEVSANSAVQDADNPGLVTMEQIQGRMTLDDGGWFRVEADGGEYNSDTNILTLTEDIEVTVSTGYVARLNGARVDFQEGRVDTSNPVLVFMNAGIVTGNAMSMLNKGELVRFTGGTTMTINGRAGNPASDK